MAGTRQALIARAMACGMFLAALAPTQAWADIFTITWTDSNGPSASFQIDTSLPPYFSNADGFFYGQPTDNIAFLNSAGYVSQGLPGLNFNRDDGTNSYVYSGSNLYSGTTSAPSFTPGSYNLTGAGIGNEGSSAILQIARVGAPGGAAPEVGMGLLALLAAAAALAVTRMRKPWFARAGA